MIAGRRYRFYPEELTLIPLTLDDYGLRPDDIVRFDQPGHRPVEARVIGANKDGSIDCVELKSGRTRSIPVHRLVVKHRGPRGGISWVPVVPPAPEVATPQAGVG